jgi:zinc transport system ATP-binding protein
MSELLNSSSASPVIVVQDLTYGYTKGEAILQNVSFNIKRGEFVGLIGPNGGGKTTLLKLLMGFLQPWSGTISIFGKPPKTYPNGIGYVPQTLRFDRHFPITVFDLVLGGRLSHLPWWGTFSQQDKEQAYLALEQVRLTEFCQRPFGTLSGGQMQRALIARALAQDPEILLLDEPTASVDIQNEANIYDILQTIRQRLTILMVTHDIRAIIQHVQRVLCVQGRAVILEPRDVCEHFALGLYHFPLIFTPEEHLKVSFLEQEHLST